MINYYSRPDNAFVKADSDSKQITNVLNTVQQKTISHIDNEDYYNRIEGEFVNFTAVSESDFNTAFAEVKAHLDNL